MPRITAKFIESEVQCPSTGQLIIRDDELKGFGLRVTRTCMSFIAEHRINGRVRRVTLGKYGPMMPEEARREARKILFNAEPPSCMAQNGSVSTITLSEVLEKFLAIRKLRPNTVRSYSQITRRCLGDWLNQPVASITKDMIQSRHHDLTKTTKQGSSGEVQANMAMRTLRTLLNFAANNYETIDGNF